ncbi:MAG: sigma-70 family RNA polymerase sigma factor [Bacilli bacterium]|nr:sigma-70 family RNA polymerase sigma factor [Bacilli bacterium]
MKSEYKDEQLIELVHENNEDAKSILFNRYKDKIDYLIKKYTIVAKTLGIDIKDLNQEALVGFTDAILNYIPEKEASLSTYICVCVERKIKKACIKASTTKHQIMKDTLSLDYTYDDINIPLKELIEDVDSDPLIKITEQERYEELLEQIKKSLSDNEAPVFDLMILGLDYKDIANILDKEAKQIDNAIQRIKSKIKKILEERNK